LLIVSVQKCSLCGTELIPEAKFCRRCGATAGVGVATSSSELPTEILSQNVINLTTGRLEPRPTSPDPRSPGLLGDAVHPAAIKTHVPAPRRRRRAVFIGGAILVVIFLGLIASVAYVRIRNHSRTTDSTALVYPQAQTIVDLTSAEGRALQLQTRDPLERVVAWYEASLKPTKTMRLTSTSVVLKNSNVTATIASEAGKTNILIKQLP
jgi:hypothetical protein